MIDEEIGGRCGAKAVGIREAAEALEGEGFGKGKPLRDAVGAGKYDFHRRTIVGDQAAWSCWLASHSARIGSEAQQDFGERE